MTRTSPERILCRLLLAVTIVVCCTQCTNSLFVESRDIVQGQVDGFAVGMSKQQVLEAARQKHVFAIRPVLGEALSINYSNLTDLKVPDNGRSIELDNGSSLKVRYVFDKCRVAELKSLSTQSAPARISAGESSDDFVEGLKDILGNDHALSVHEVVDSENGSWLSLDQPTQAAKIAAYDVWSFELSSIKPAGAQFLIYFSEGSVVRISFKRPRIRVE